MAEIQRHQGEFNGLVFGEGTQFVVAEPIEIWGWQSRASDLALPRAHGAIPSEDFLAGETHVLTLLVWGHGLDEAEANVEKVMAAFRPHQSEAWLRWRTATRTWRIRCRPTRIAAPYGPDQAHTAVFKVTIALTQADPRVYADNQRTLRVPVYDPVGAVGAVYEVPTDLPLNVDASEGVGGEQLVTVDGTTVAYPVITVANEGDADVEAVQLDNLATGVSFRVETTLTTGQELVADMDRIVRAAAGAPHVHVDGASRFSHWQQPREPWGLEPGVINRLRFFVEGAGVDPADVVCRLTWRDTWM